MRINIFIVMLLFTAFWGCKTTQTVQKNEIPSAPKATFNSWKYFDEIKKDSVPFPPVAKFSVATVRHFKEVLNEKTRQRVTLDSINLKPSQVEETTILVQQFSPSDLLARCYEPHHEIIYRNEKGETVGILEICFLCAQMTYYSDYRKTRFALEKTDAEKLKKLLLSYGVLITEQD